MSSMAFCSMTAAFFSNAFSLRAFSWAFARAGFRLAANLLLLFAGELLGLGAEAFLLGLELPDDVAQALLLVAEFEGERLGRVVDQPANRDNGFLDGLAAGFDAVDEGVHLAKHVAGNLELFGVGDGDDGLGSGEDAVAGFDGGLRRLTSDGLAMPERVMMAVLGLMGMNQLVGRLMEAGRDSAASGSSGWFMRRLALFDGPLVAGMALDGSVDAIGAVGGRGGEFRHVALGEVDGAFVAEQIPS